MLRHVICAESPAPESSEPISAGMGGKTIVAASRVYGS
jgi:hypothetical protein